MYIKAIPMPPYVILAEKNNKSDLEKPRCICTYKLMAKLIHIIIVSSIGPYLLHISDPGLSFRQG